MRKEKNKKCNYWIGIVLVVLLVLGCTFFIYMKIEKETTGMGKQVCHEEIQVKKIIANCGFEHQYIPANAERICDDGISGSTEKIDHENIIWDCNMDDVARVCLYKEIVEVCEIVYN